MHKTSSKILSIIPARSGSTRVKNKNLRKLGGLPLIYYTIKASLKSNVTRTIVSTDDKNIAKIARKFGAEVPFLRPKKFATPKSSSIAVVLHCLKFLKEKENYAPDYVVYLQPTSPFRSFYDINRGLRKILNSKYNSLVGLSEINQHPYWMFKKNKHGKIDPFLKIKKRPERSQDLIKLYHINGSLAITRANFFQTVSGKQYILDLKSTIGLEMDPIHSFDIDTEIDFKMAESFLKN